MKQMALAEAQCNRRSHALRTSSTSGMRSRRTCCLRVTERRCRHEFRMPQWSPQNLRPLMLERQHRSAPYSRRGVICPHARGLRDACSVPDLGFATMDLDASAPLECILQHHIQTPHRLRTAHDMCRRDARRDVHSVATVAALHAGLFAVPTRTEGASWHPLFSSHLEEFCVLCLQRPPKDILKACRRRDV